MQLEELKKLAVMARLDMPEEEMLEIAQSFDAILAYVGQVQEVSNSQEAESLYLVENIMREDISTNIPGMYTEKILSEMPHTEAGFLKVKQIL